MTMTAALSPTAILNAPADGGVSASRFSTSLWADSASLREAIDTMPFNVELAAGTLSPSAFRHYIVQDAHYLTGFARALALAAAKADTPEQVAMLSASASGAIAVERSLHDSYMAAFGIAPDVFAATEPTPVCSHYVNFLVATAATASFPVAVTALLPCFWIYREVGRDIAGRAGAANPYQAWIDTYAGEAFDQAVRRMIALTDDLALAASADTREQMKAVFRQSTRLEWMFWDSAYREAGWPL
jgi:thiaminase/transcriptional activator TenA